MESFAQEHVVGIPLASFAYAQEETQGKPSCSALIHKKSKNLTTCFFSSPFATALLCRLILICHPFNGYRYIRRLCSFIGWAKLSQKTDSYMQGFKEHCKNPTIVLSWRKKDVLCEIVKSSDHWWIFFLCSKPGTKTFRNHQREIELRCKGSTSWQHW
jgi:hypothetical protein